MTRDRPRYNSRLWIVQLMWATANQIAARESCWSVGRGLSLPTTRCLRTTAQWHIRFLHSQVCLILGYEEDHKPLQRRLANQYSSLRQGRPPAAWVPVAAMHVRYPHCAELLTNSNRRWYLLRVQRYHVLGLDAFSGNGPRTCIFVTGASRGARPRSRQRTPSVDRATRVTFDRALSMN